MSTIQNKKIVAKDGHFKKTCQGFSATGKRLFGYRQKAFRLQAKGLSLVAENSDGDCFVPGRGLFCTAMGTVLYLGYDMMAVRITV